VTLAPGHYVNVGGRWVPCTRARWALCRMHDRLAYLWIEPTAEPPARRLRGLNVPDTDAPRASAETGGGDMAAKRIFSCNFCGKEFGPVERAEQNLIGVYWTTNTTLERRAVLSTENHVCRTCLTALATVAGVAENTEK
jgi:hypothetical protein